MSHVAQADLEIHAGIPNTIEIGPLLDEDDEVVEPQAAPQLAIYDLAGNAVDEVSGAPALTFPVAMEAGDAEGSWKVELTTLSVSPGQRLRTIVTFTDPEGNPCTLIYPTLVVPPVGS